MEKKNDGQARSESYYNPGGMNSGMKQSFRPAACVGMTSGGEQQMSVPKPARDCMINTTTGSAGPRSPGEITSGDDK